MVFTCAKRNVISTIWEFGGFHVVDLHVLGSFKQGGSLSLSAMNVKVFCVSVPSYISAFFNYCTRNGRNIAGLLSNGLYYVLMYVGIAIKCKKNQGCVS